MFILFLVVSAILSYLCGGLNGAIVMSSLCYHQDIRELGSKNPGFTNFKRVYGLNFKTWLVMLIDVLKTVNPVLLSAIVENVFFFDRLPCNMWQFGAAFSGLFGMIGHCFPVWYAFKGGKAFVSGFTVAWFIDWRMALIATAIFFLLLFTLRFMSVASCVATLSYPVSLAFLGWGFGGFSWIVVGLTAACSLLVILRHIPNFLKLAHGTESKFYIKSKK